MECMILGSSSKPCLFSSFPTGTTGERSSSVKLQHFSSLCSSSILTSGGKRSRRKVLNARERFRFSGYQQHSINHSAGKIKESLTFLQKLDETFAVNATSEQPLESGPDAYSPKSTQNSLSEAFNAFYRFSRPHTIIGTTLSIISVSLLAVQKWSDFSLDFFTGMLAAIVAALLMNIYIVGLNQLADIEIDKVNKPYLPLASGEYSLGTGIMIIASSAIMSFFLGWVSGSRPLCWALLVSFLLGTAYSINFPLLRWKRFAVIAASCIVAVRAVIVQLAFYLHVQCHVYKRPAVYSKPVIFATAFMSFFSVVIALFKDIPDITGDMKFGIQSFSVKLGQERVFWICISLLQMAYAVAIVVGASSCNLGTKCITILGHFMLASILWIRAKSIDLKSPTEITSFYMFIWKLFYAEYFLIPLVR